MRVAMCLWFFANDNQEFLNEVWFSDDANLNGHFNSKNAVGVQWRSECFLFGEMRKLTESLDNFCILKMHGLQSRNMAPFDHFSLKNNQENAVTVIKEFYIPVFEQFFGKFKKGEDFDEEEQWFKQDKATPHTTNGTMAWL